MKIKKLLLEKYTEQRIASMYYYLTLHKIQKQVEEQAEQRRQGKVRLCIYICANQKQSQRKQRRYLSW